MDVNKNVVKPLLESSSIDSSSVLLLLLYLFLYPVDWNIDMMAEMPYWAVRQGTHTGDHRSKQWKEPESLRNREESRHSSLEYYLPDFDIRRKQTFPLFKLLLFSVFLLLIVELNSNWQIQSLPLWSCYSPCLPILLLTIRIICLLFLVTFKITSLCFVVSLQYV